MTSRERSLSPSPLSCLPALVGTCTFALNVAGGTDGFVGFTNLASGSLGAAHRFGNYGNSIEASSGLSPAYWDAPVLISRVPSGSPTFGLSYAPTGSNLGMVDIPSQFLDGRARVIGLCYEVVNATAPLYTSGQCGTYALPSNTRHFTATVGETYGSGTQIWSASTLAQVGSLTATTPVNAPVNCAISTAPPSNVALASRAHNWVTWHAKEGCYVNAVFESIPEMTFPAPVKRFVQDSGQSALGQLGQTIMGLDSGFYMDSSGNVGTRRVIVRSDTTAATSGGAAVSSFDYDHWVNRTVDVPVRRSGAYFTGLNENSVLQLKVRFIIERVPDIFDERLYSLSQLPPMADPRFWEMYTRVCQHVPSGCMQTENPLGEWFNSLTDTVKRWAPVIGNTVGNFIPGASALGHVVGKAASVANHMNRGSEKLHKKDEKAREKHAAKAHAGPAKKTAPQQHVHPK